MYYILSFISTGIGGRYDILIYIFFFIIFIYMMLKRKIIIPKEINLLILIVFCITYTIINSFYQEITFFLLIGPIIMYYSGIVMIRYCKKDAKEEYIIKCIFAIMIGLFIHAMLNFSINIGSESRNTIDFWTGKVMSATLQGILLTPIFSLIFFTIIFIKEKKVKIVMAICFIFALAYDMVIATRSALVIAVLSFIISFISYIIMDNSRKNKIKMLSVIFIIIFIAVLLYVNNAFNINSIIKESNLYSRIGKDETEKSDYNRIEAQIEGIKQVIEYPFGVPKNILTAGLSYAHNMWLDTARQTGIIPLTFLILFFILNIKSFIKLIRNRKIMLKLKILLISVYATFLLMFSIEPILQAMPVAFALFCMIMGFVDTLTKILEEDKKEANESFMDS